MKIYYFLIIVSASFMVLYLLTLMHRRETRECEITENWESVWKDRLRTGK